MRVDIHAPAIVIRDVATGREQRRPVAEHVGFAVPAAGRGLLAGIGRALVALDPGLRVLATVEPGLTENRFNDAVVDPRGRLWAGTMSTTRKRGTAALYRYTGDGQATVAIPGVTISNGLDFDRDATRLYYVDSLTQRIDALDFDVDRGRLGTRRPLARIDPADGLPDGLCVDADGGIWVALFGGGAIRRYLPDGRLDASVELPVTNPTSVAFGGRDLRDLYVTSARHRLTDAQLAREPLAGSLLRLRPGVAGRVTGRFGAP